VDLPTHASAKGVFDMLKDPITALYGAASAVVAPALQAAPGAAPIRPGSPLRVMLRLLLDCVEEACGCAPYQLLSSQGLDDHGPHGSSPPMRAGIGTGAGVPNLMDDVLLAGDGAAADTPADKSSSASTVDVARLEVALTLLTYVLHGLYMEGVNVRDTTDGGQHSVMLPAAGAFPVAPSEVDGAEVPFSAAHLPRIPKKLPRVVWKNR